MMLNQCSPRPSRPAVTNRCKTGLFAANRLILLALLIAVFYTDAGADADGPDYWRVVGVAEGDSLNIRAPANGIPQRWAKYLETAVVLPIAVASG